MMSIADITELRDAAKKAWLIAVNGASYGVSTSGTNRNFTRQNLSELKSQLDYWDRRLDQISNNTGMKIRYGKSLR